MIGWVLATFGVALASSLMPLISAEVFVVAVAMHHHPPIVWFGLAAGSGQLVGKLLYFHAARGDIHLPPYLHRKILNRPPPAAVPANGWRRFTRRVRAAWEWLRVRCHRHPYWMVGATVSASFVGVPPFFATTILAGLAGLRLRTFLAAALPVRCLRFSLLAASPAFVAHLPFFHHHAG